MSIPATKAAGPVVPPSPGDFRKVPGIAASLNDHVSEELVVLPAQTSDVRAIDWRITYRT